MITEIIQNFPVTTDVAIMEQVARLDYMTDENGYEWYATFANVDGELIQITDWEGFENAWESYNGLFCPDCVRKSFFAKILEILQ